MGFRGRSSNIGSLDGLASPLIRSVPGGISRPFWSVMIPTYNCAEYLRQTLASVLAQDPGAEQMQIEVIDDCSTMDDPEAVVNEFASGRVSFHRQPLNVGASRNFNACIERSRGHLVHILHGDDLVLNGFYRSYEKLFLEHPNLGWIYGNVLRIDGNGRVIQAEDRALRNQTDDRHDFFNDSFLTGNSVYAPAVVVKRDCYEQIGGFDQRLSHTCDWEMWMRLSLFFEMAFVQDPLVKYRLHDKNDGHQFSNNARGLEQCYLAKLFILEKCSSRIQQHKQLRRSTRREFADRGMRLALYYYSNRQDREAKELSKLILKAYPRMISNDRFLKLCAKLWLGKRKVEWISRAKARLIA